MARFHILSAGYGGSRVASTVSLVESGDQVIVVDPGMVSAREAILEGNVGLPWRGLAGSEQQGDEPAGQAETEP